jgi:hypothetical protein
MHDIGMAQGWLWLASAVLVLTAAFAVVFIVRIRAARRFKNALNVYALREMADSAPLKGPKRAKSFATR